ncbi:MAG: hypothetical protein LQ350_006141, partial [Teloschistes chrysophthalmus]
MLSKERDLSSQFYGYPQPRQAPETPPYVVPSGSNPVLRGLPLAIVGTIASKLNLIGSLLWSNTGFGTLHEIKELDDYEPIYDPTVIKLSGNEDVNSENDRRAGESRNDDQEISNGHYSAAYYTSAYRASRLTPTKVATSLLDHISANKHHNVAFLQIRRDKVLDAAAASTERYQSGKPLSPLDGVPVAVKDEADLNGYEKTLGSTVDFTRKDGATTWCVKKWEEAGAVIVGKLNMHEIGLDTTNNNPYRGTPLNPHNPNYYTGGSSGGSAYAVAAGLIPITLGADGGGSIRIPAAYCGLYGLKPTHGRVSIRPTPNLASTNGVMGPLTSNMADLELAYRILATPDPSNPTSSLFAPPSPSTSPSPSPPSSSFPQPTTTTTTTTTNGNKKKSIIGIHSPYFTAASPPVLTACQSALSHYRSLGHPVVEIPLPHLHSSQLAHALTILSEISARIAFTNPSILPHLTPANKLLVSVGRQTPAADFLAAQKLRALLMRHLA